MSFVYGFENDIFLSYSQKDDVASSFEVRGWVSGFAEDLEKSLQIRAGCPIRIWKGAGARDAYDIQYAIQESAIFVSLVSKAYLNSAYCYMEVSSVNWL